MANEIKALYGTVTNFTKTLASLASSTAGVGRQVTLIDNTTTKYQRVYVLVKIKLGTSPTANRAIYVYGIRGDGTSRDDGAGASDAAWTRKNAKFLDCPNTGGPSIILCGSAATGDVFTNWFVFENPGREFGIGIVHDTGVNLDSTEGNHTLSYYGENPEVQ